MVCSGVYMLCTCCTWFSVTLLELCSVSDQCQNLNITSYGHLPGIIS